MILETGVNKNNPIREILNEYNVTTNNNMKEILEGKE